MSAALLQQAIDCLKIKDVFQRSTLARIEENYEPSYSDAGVMIQFKHVVTQSQIIKVNEDDEPSLFRVFVDVGARWVAEADKVENISETEDGAGVMALIEATFVAEYKIEGNPDKNALNEFALKNASFHVWPYWREYLMSQSMRMNLPKVALPAVQFAANKDAHCREEESQ